MGLARKKCSIFNAQCSMLNGKPNAILCVITFRILSPISYICYMRLACTTCIAILFLTSFLPPQQFRKIVINGTAQGTTYNITYYASDSIITKYQADSLLNKIDSSLSIYKPYSLISQFN